MKSKNVESSASYGPGCWSYLFWAVWIAMTAAGWVRFGISLKSWYWLDQAGVKPGAAYLAASGALWGLAGLAAMVWMGARRPGYRRVGMGAALFFAVSYWLDRPVFSRPDGTWTNFPFAFLMTVLGIGYVFVVLRPFRIAAPEERA